MTREDHEDAHFLAFVAHNTKAYGHYKGKWRKALPRQGGEPQRIGNPPFSFVEYRREHGGCWVCYGKGRSHKHDHKTCKVYEEDKRAYSQAHPEKLAKEKRIDEWIKRQADRGQHVGSSQTVRHCSKSYVQTFHRNGGSRYVLCQDVFARYDRTPTGHGHLRIFFALLASCRRMVAIGGFGKLMRLPSP